MSSVRSLRLMSRSEESEKEASPGRKSWFIMDSIVVGISDIEDSGFGEY